MVARYGLAAIEILNTKTTAKNSVLTIFFSKVAFWQRFRHLGLATLMLMQFATRLLESPRPCVRPCQIEPLPPRDACMITESHTICLCDQFVIFIVNVWDLP